MNKEHWIVLAAYYPPHQIGGGEVSDHWILRQAVRDGVQVTVWCESEHDDWDDVYEGVTVRHSPAARERFYADIARRHPTRVFLSGPITVVPWRIPPATRPVLLLRSQAYLPLIHQLAPILDAVVVPSVWFKDTVHTAQPTFPEERIYVSYPNLPRIEVLPRRNARFITIASAEVHKGIALCTALASQLPSADFLVADGLHPAAVEQVRSAARRLPNLFISERHQTMQQIYFMTKVLIAPAVPSMHIETFGKAIAEAILYGVPALTYPLGAPQEYLDERLLVRRDEASMTGQLAAWEERLQWCNDHPEEVSEAVVLSARRLRDLELPHQAAQLVHTLRSDH